MKLYHTHSPIFPSNCKTYHMHYYFSLSFFISSLPPFLSSLFFLHTLKHKSNSIIISLPFYEGQTCLSNWLNQVSTKSKSLDPLVKDFSWSDYLKWEDPHKILIASSPWSLDKIWRNECLLLPACLDILWQVLTVNIL